MSFAALILASAGALAQSGGVLARLECAPRQAEIGQPVEWTLRVEAPAGSSVLLPEQDPALDGSWIVLAPRRVERREEQGRLELRVHWTLASLEPGARFPWSFELPVETPTGRENAKAEAVALEVRAALAAGEDAPRPPKGFLDAPPEPPSRAWIVWSALALMPVALAAWLFARRARRLRRERAAAAVPGATARLAALEAELREHPERVRELVFELTHLLRRRADQWLEVERPALTDEDWARALSVDERVPAGVRSASARVLERAAAIKYALATPSPFLVEELCADARGVLQVLESAPRPAAPAGVAA